MLQTFWAFGVTMLQRVKAVAKRVLRHSLDFSLQLQQKAAAK